MRRLVFSAALILCLGWSPTAQAQPTPLTLKDAVKLAIDNYPAVRAARANIEVSAAGLGLARTAYLPRADVLFQWNRATRNSVTGMLLPQPVVAGISGGVGVDKNETAWGSATGVLLNWEPFDFGVRGASVQTAQATLRRATASEDLTELQVATSAADAFLSVVATQQTLRAAQAAVDRAKVLFDVVSARVQAGLRPGVDAQRARAELALAENIRIVAEQNANVARVVLAQYTGLDPTTVTVNPGSVLGLPPADAVAPAMTILPAGQAGLSTHPQATEQNAAVDESQIGRASCRERVCQYV